MKNKLLTILLVLTLLFSVVSCGETSESVESTPESSGGVTVIEN